MNQMVLRAASQRSSQGPLSGGRWYSVRTPESSSDAGAAPIEASPSVQPARMAPAPTTSRSRSRRPGGLTRNPSNRVAFPSAVQRKSPDYAKRRQRPRPVLYTPLRRARFSAVEPAVPGGYGGGAQLPPPTRAP